MMKPFEMMKALANDMVIQNVNHSLVFLFLFTYLLKISLNSCLG